MARRWSLAPCSKAVWTPSGRQRSAAASCCGRRPGRAAARARRREAGAPMHQQPRVQRRQVQPSGGVVQVRLFRSGTEACVMVRMRGQVFPRRNSRTCSSLSTGWGGVDQHPRHRIGAGDLPRASRKRWVAVWRCGQKWVAAAGFRYFCTPLSAPRPQRAKGRVYTVIALIAVSRFGPNGCSPEIARGGRRSDAGAAGWQDAGRSG